MRQNGSDRLTDKQERRLRNAPGAPKGGGSLAAQHQAVREQAPVTPQAAVLEPRRISQDELVDFITSHNDPNWRGETFRIDSTHTNEELVKKDLSSARSRIGRHVKRAGLQYSTQILRDDEGDQYLAVHLSI
jgi:hypothetical protein